MTNDKERAAFRAFVRDNHPDRGGDPDVFVAGLARFRADASPEHVSPFPSESGAYGTADARFDAPIEVVSPLPVPLRVAVAVIRTLRWHRHRRPL